MRILLLGFLSLLAGCAVEASNTQTTTPQETATPQGYSVSLEYTGSYTCPQGPTDVDLKVLSNPNNPAVQYAIFSFGPPGTDLNNNPQGSYLMNGTFDLGSGDLALQPVSWIKEPLFFTMVGMSGNSSDGGATFSGTINSQGCGNFQISNIAGASSSPYAAWFSAAPQLQSQTVLTVKAYLSSNNINITPDIFATYITYYMKTVAPDGNADDPAAIESLIEAAEPLREKGLTVAQAIYYSSNNIAYNEISQFNANKHQYDAKKNAVLQQCGGRISNNDITQMSPYAVQGQCFQIGSTQVSQWVDQGSALVSNFGLYLDFPDTQQTNTFNDIIVMGEAPYSYQATSGAALTIPRAQVLMYVDESLEIPAPPGPGD